jgi:hypothetical protein
MVEIVAYTAKRKGYESEPLAYLLIKTPSYDLTLR